MQRGPGADDPGFQRTAESGMSPKQMEKVFTPFYTTKPVGKGTGLGLSISYGIMQRHQGDIEVNSEVGKGTTFTLRFPLVMQASQNDLKSSVLIGSN